MCGSVLRNSLKERPSVDDGAEKKVMEGPIGALGICKYLLPSPPYTVSMKPL